MKYFIIIISISYLFAGKIKNSSEEYLLSQFAKGTRINIHTLQLNKKIKIDIQNKVKQTFYRDKLYYWNISRNDTTIAYAFLDNVLGKSMPITFIVIIDINGNIINTEVIKYREAYGGEVANKRWLAQFMTRNINSNYIVGEDIDGISGATISVNSLSKGIQKLAMLYPIIKNELKK